MEELSFIDMEERAVHLYPVAAKMVGRYPENFLTED